MKNCAKERNLAYWLDSAVNWKVGIP